MEGQAAMCLLPRAGKGFQAKGSSAQAEEGWRWEVVNTHSLSYARPGTVLSILQG